jgi:hypothetical protein
MTGQRPPPTWSKYQRQGPGFQASPVEPRTRSVEQVVRSTGSSRATCRARIAVGATAEDGDAVVGDDLPEAVRDRGGRGALEDRTVAPEGQGPAMAQGPIIQPRSVYKKRLSSVWRSKQ